MKLVCWNVNGLRSICRKGFADFLKREKPGLICVQETKASPSALAGEELHPAGYGSFFSSAAKAGYSGVATFYAPSAEKPGGTREAIGIKKYDSEGRFLISSHPEFELYNIYIPSGTTGDTRQSFKYRFLDDFSSHIKSLPKKTFERLIICGDFNICHREIDIHHPREAEKRELSGFLPEERKWFDEFMALGFVDSFRHVHGDKERAYTWWSFRANSRGKNLGWRIDYFLVSKSLASRIKGASILDKVTGSDHCPIVLEMDLG